jgi:hypothetical protein
LVWNVDLKLSTRKADLKRGAHEWNRTIDLLLTKEVLYRLSYVSGKFFYCCRETIRWWNKWLNGAGEGNRTLVISLEN